MRDFSAWFDIVCGLSGPILMAATFFLLAANVWWAWTWWGFPMVLLLTWRVGRAVWVAEGREAYWRGKMALRGYRSFRVTTTYRFWE